MIELEEEVNSAMLNLKRRNGQSMAEYAIVLTVVVSAIVAMQIYVKRGLQGKVKDVTDQVGFGLLDVGYATTTSQYEPYYAQTEYQIGQNQTINEAYQDGGTVSRTSIAEESTRTGSATTGVDQGSDDQWQ